MYLKNYQKRVVGILKTFFETSFETRVWSLKRQTNT